MIWGCVEFLLLERAKGMRQACMLERRGEERRVLGFGGKPEGKGPLGGPKYRWEGNIMMELQEVGCGDLDWI